MDATAEAERWQRIGRVIRAATGEEYGDGHTVTDVLKGYAEPGYGSDESVIILGNWNPPRWPSGDDEPLSREERLPIRLAAALEWLGCELEWLDEWTRCDACYRAMRTEPDSYSWTMHGAFVEEEGAYVCADCMQSHLEDYLAGYIDNPRNAVAWTSGAKLESLGWAQWEPGDPHEYETGWHPGQNDDPERVLAEIKDREGDDVEVVFLIDAVGQFDCRWSAYVKKEQYV